MSYAWFFAVLFIAMAALALVAWRGWARALRELSAANDLVGRYQRQNRRLLRAVMNATNPHKGEAA